MLSTSEERMLKYIEEKALKNVQGKNYFRMTDILEDAFCLTEENAYDALKNIMSRKNIGNSKYDIIDEYIDMLKKGYGSIQDQINIFGGDKLTTVINTAKKRTQEYDGGTFFDALREIYKVEEDELLEVTEKYLDFVSSPTFMIRLEEDTFNKFLESDVDELDKQYERFMKEEK